jgi:hypothetical protein
VSSCVHWAIEDEHGDNPTMRAGNFEFRIWYEIDPGYRDVMYTANGDGYPGSPPSVNLLSADCTDVYFEDEQEHRAPTEDEKNVLDDWCLAYLNACPSERSAVQDRALEYSYVEPDYDDRDDD